MEQIRAQIWEVYHQNKLSGWYMAGGRMEFTESRIKVVGVGDFLPIRMIVTMEGEWKNHPKYGRQFDCKRIIYGSHLESIAGLLSSGFLWGIREAKAVELVETLGEDIIGIMDSAAREYEADDDDSTTEGQAAVVKMLSVKGIGKYVLRELLSSWREERDWALAALTCTRCGLTLKQAKKIFAHFPNSVIEIIYDSPYQLTVIPGITWDIADGISKEKWEGKKPIDHNSPMRFAAGVREILRVQQLNGQACVPIVEAIDESIRLCKPTLNRSPYGFWNEVVGADLDAQGLCPVQTYGDWYLYRPYLMNVEQKAATILHSLMLGRSVQSHEAWVHIENELDRYSSSYLPVGQLMSDDQRAAIRMCLENPVSVITGGPGTGKTTTLGTLCRIFRQLGKTYTLCAPTGKAARRMTEAIRSPAGTIHRTIQLGIKEEDLPRATFGTEYVIIDEMSMCDAGLFYKTLKAVPQGTNLILVGDVDQLPPVGAGEPFYQCIEDIGLPTTRLEVIHRQGKDSGIIHAAEAIRKGKMPSADGYSDFYVGTCSNNKDLAKQAISLITKIAEKYGCSAIDVQVLTPLNGHPWGQAELNKKLQTLVNPGPYPLKGSWFKVGDRVIQMRNNYDLGNDGIMNGQVGTIRSMATNDDLQFKDDPVIATVQFDDEFVHYGLQSIADLALAYALTVHKVQGSEYDKVILLVPTTRPSFQTRQLIYTGLTRAKQYILVLTSHDAMWQYISNEERIRRNTLLGGWFHGQVRRGMDLEVRDIFNSKAQDDLSMEAPPPQTDSDMWVLQEENIW